MQMTQRTASQLRASSSSTLPPHEGFTEFVNLIDNRREGCIPRPHFLKQPASFEHSVVLPIERWPNRTPHYLVPIAQIVIIDVPQEK
jgi:hypothetical protein